MNSADDFDIQPIRCLYLILYVWKEETHIYTMTPINESEGFSFQFHMRWYQPSLVNRLTVVRRVKRALRSYFVL